MICHRLKLDTSESNVASAEVYLPPTLSVAKTEIWLMISRIDVSLRRAVGLKEVLSRSVKSLKQSENLCREASIYPLVL